MNSNQMARIVDIERQDQTQKVTPDQVAHAVAASTKPAAGASMGPQLAAIAKVLAVFLTAGGLVLHLMGFVSHRSYLSEWGVDHGLFPLATDAILIKGFHAFVDRAANLLGAMNLAWDQVVGAMTLFTIYMFLILWLMRSGKGERIYGRVKKAPVWIGDLLKSIALSLLSFAAMPVALVFLVAILLIPAVLAERYGTTCAREELAEYKGGCGAAKNGLRCIELRKDGGTIAKGYLIESSPTHIALYDVNELRARAIERKGIEVAAEARKAK